MLSLLSDFAIPMRTLLKVVVLAVLMSWFAANAHDKSDDKNPELSFSCAWFDFIQHRNEAFGLTVEYRSSEYIWNFRPFIGMMTTEKGTAASFAGLLMDIVLFSNLYLTPSFAPGMYYSGRGKEMYYGLEFRSQIELTYNLTFIRLGINFNHISNGHLYKINPGVESLSFNLILPLN